MLIKKQNKVVRFKSFLDRGGLGEATLIRRGGRSTTRERVKPVCYILSLNYFYISLKSLL